MRGTVLPIIIRSGRSQVLIGVWNSSDLVFINSPIILSAVFIHFPFLCSGSVLRIDSIFDHR